MLRGLRLATRLILCVIGAMWLRAPAAAWQVHQIEHSAQPVAIGEHHHHDDHGSVVEEASHDSSQKSDDQGHDHLPSLMAGMNGVLAEISFSPPQMLPAIVAEALPAKAPVGLIEAPPPRPPSFG
jgi:hypothetical protein